MLQMNTGNRVHAVKVRGNDLYQTPTVAVRALQAVERLPQKMWEPACGPGAIATHLRQHGHTIIATDLVDYGLEDSTSGVDFLMETRAPDGCSTIITNPPFKSCTDFVRKALDLCPEVHMLMRVAFLEGLRWQYKQQFAPHLARVWVFAPRIPMMHREGYEGPKNSNSGMAFAWYVFKRDHLALTGCRPTVDWLDWRTTATPEEIAAAKDRKGAVEDVDEDEAFAFESAAAAE